MSATVTETTQARETAQATDAQRPLDNPISTDMLNASAAPIAADAPMLPGRVIPEVIEIAAALQVDGTYNFRSTGGYAADRGTTRTQGLYRSDALHRVSETGAEQFAGHGISRIIDLRHEHELASQPSALPEGSVEIVHHPIFEEGSISTAGQVVSLAELYRTIATDRVGALVGAVRLIADAPEGGVLVHCTAGKDRTGMVVAVALLAVGVSREQVIADYAATEANLAGEWADRMLSGYAAHMQAPIDDAIRELVTKSPGEALIEALDLIDTSYGSAKQMLLLHGFDESALDRLRGRLVA